MLFLSFRCSLAQTVKPRGLEVVPDRAVPAVFQRGFEGRGRLVHDFVALLRGEVMYKPAAALEAALEESWNGPIWQSLKTPWLDGLDK